ncbi:MAG: hypothetical protein EA343_00910 [Nodularia sp. (in: Bacteria)]|nr:MAG: hypothetical protein EA343_00910 [Nodularia sp. (in: cyanobacteria)]
MIIRGFLSRSVQVSGLFLLSVVVGRVSDPMNGYSIVRCTCQVSYLHPVISKVFSGGKSKYIQIQL